MGICIQRIVNYVKRKGNCNLVATSYILKHHIPGNIPIETNLRV